MSTKNSLIYPSSENPELLTVSFESEPKADLGVQLRNLDKGDQNAEFFPGYTAVLKVKDGNNLARRSGVEPGDFLVAVSGKGFRRIPPDFEGSNPEEESNRVIAGKDVGEHYKFLLNHIKSIKKLADPGNALILNFERYHWDSRPNSWPRFLAARNNNKSEAMEMMMKHESWRSSFFPIDYLSLGNGKSIKPGTMKEICVNGLQHPIVYINCEKLASLGENEYIVKALVALVETLLSNNENPSSPKISFLLHAPKNLKLTEYREQIQDIYNVFADNYPGVVHKIAICPLANVEELAFISQEARSKIFCTQVNKTAFYHLGLSESKISNIEDINTLELEHGKEVFNLPSEEETEKDDNNLSPEAETNNHLRPSLDDMSNDELYASIRELRQERMLELEEFAQNQSITDFDLLTAVQETSDNELVEAITKLREDELIESETKELGTVVSTRNDTDVETQRPQDKDLHILDQLNANSKNKFADAVSNIKEQRNKELAAMRKGKNKSKGDGVKNELRALADKHFSSVVDKMKEARAAELAAMRNTSSQSTAEKPSDPSLSSRQQRLLEMEQLRESKMKKEGSGTIDALAKKDEEKLSSAVKKMREKREAEMKQMKENKAGDAFRKVAANLNFAPEKFETDSSAEKAEEINEDQSKALDNNDPTKIDKNKKSIDKVLAQKDGAKLADAVSIIRKQREEEMKLMKQSKAADSVVEKVEEPNEENSKAVDSSVAPKVDTNKMSMDKALAQKDGEKLADAVALIRKQREEEMKLMKQSKAADAVVEKVEEPNEDKNKAVDNSVAPKIDTNKKSMDIALAQKDGAKLADAVALLRKQREEEMKLMKQSKAADEGRNLIAKLSEGKAQDVSGMVQEMRKERDKEMEQLRQNKEPSATSAAALKKITSPVKSHNVSAKPKKAVRVEESPKHHLKKETIEIKSKEFNDAMHTIPRETSTTEEITDTPADKKSDVERNDTSTPVKIRDTSSFNITKGASNGRESIVTPIKQADKTVPPESSSRKKDILPSSLTAESKEKELANAVFQLRGQRSAEIEELRQANSTKALQEQIFGAKEFQVSNQSHIEELQASKAASVVSIRDAMLIPLVDYKNNDFRTFIFVVHKDHGLLVLQFKNKILKRDDYKIPGGRIVENEFMASARISGGDVQRELVNASKFAAARELYNGTGIDVREKVERIIPLELWKDKKENVDSDYSCELKKRVYFILNIDDSDFITQDLVSDDESQYIVSSELEDGKILMLKLSKECTGFSFHKNFENVSDLIKTHSGGVSSTALSMALEVESVVSMHKPILVNENVDEDLFLPKKKENKGFLSCLTCWK